MPNIQREYLFLLFSANTARLFLFHHVFEGSKGCYLMEPWKRSRADRKLFHTSKEALCMCVCVCEGEREGEKET